MKVHQMWLDVVVSVVESCGASHITLKDDFALESSQSWLRHSINQVVILLAHVMFWWQMGNQVLAIGKFLWAIATFVGIPCQQWGLVTTVSHFLQWRTVVKTMFFTNTQSWFAWVVFNSVLGPSQLPLHIWQCPCMYFLCSSYVPEENFRPRLMAL